MEVMSWSHALFFFFKQKTAYELLRSLVGSEMCIRDSNLTWERQEPVLDVSGLFPDGPVHVTDVDAQVPLLSLIHI